MQTAVMPAGQPVVRAPRMRCAPCAASRGFTLVEILAVLAILGILAAVALPSYHEQIARGRRVELQTALLEDAGYMQRYYAAHNAFDGSPPPDLPVAQSPRPPAAATYRIAVVANGAGYMLTAVRIGAMSADPCGDFTYDNLGQKGLANFASGRSVASCWR